MIRVARGHGRGLVILTAVAAFAASACGGSSPTPTPTPGPTDTPVVTASPSPTPGSALAGAAAAMAGLTSYKFTMTQAGTDAVDQYSNLTTVDPPYGIVNFAGTIVQNPATNKAADVTAPQMHVISVGGFDYLDIGETGGYTQTTPNGPSASDPYTPATAFAAVKMTGYALVGTETKDTVNCDHYQASAAALAEFGSVSGIKDATWTADLWIAVDGGYPVAIAIVATAKDGTTPYEIVFDLTKINDPGNSVKAPDNVVGA